MSCVCPFTLVLFVFAASSGLIDFLIIIFLKTELEKVAFVCAASCVYEWHRACVCVRMCPCSVRGGGQGSGLFCAVLHAD